MDKKNGQLLCDSEVENLESSPKVTIKWEDFVKELKMQWGMMWRERIDDRIRAEGIARKDYSLLFLERGMIVVATRKYKPPDFLEILERHHGRIEIERRVGSVNSFLGGWGKFIKNVLNTQQRFGRRVRPEPSEPRVRDALLQQKKGGRGWVHRF